MRDPSTFESFPFLLESKHFYSSHEVKLPSPQSISSLSFDVVLESEETLLAGLGLKKQFSIL